MDGCTGLASAEPSGEWGRGPELSNFDQSLRGLSAPRLTRTGQRAVFSRSARRAVACAQRPSDMQPQSRRRPSDMQQGSPQPRRRSSRVAPASHAKRNSKFQSRSESFLDAAGDAGLLALFDSRTDRDETEPATFSKALADLISRLVHLSARTPDAVRAELRNWRREHLDALTHEDLVGLLFEELLPSVLSQLVVLKERSKVLSALGVCASIFFMCGDLFSSIGVALKLAFARSVFGYAMFGVLALSVATHILQANIEREDFKSICGSVLMLKPVIAGYRALVGYSRGLDTGLKHDPFVSLVQTQVVEVGTQTIPNAFLQAFALIHALEQTEKLRQRNTFPEGSQFALGQPVQIRRFDPRGPPGRSRCTGSVRKFIHVSLLRADTTIPRLSSRACTYHRGRPCEYLYETRGFISNTLASRRLAVKA